MKISAINIIIITFLIAAFADGFAAVVVAQDTVVITQQGRRVQLDGFLLEWNLANSRVDGVINWDAINTADGVAGYFSSSEAAALCSSWTFTITPVNTNIGTTNQYSITIPQTARSDIFAFDILSFEKDGTYNIEWIVPWKIFDNGNDNDDDARHAASCAITISAADNCGHALLYETTVITKRATASRANNNRMRTYAVIALFTATSWLVAMVARAVKKSRSRTAG